MSVVLLTRALVYGGAERQLVALAIGLHRKGHRVTVLTFYDGGSLAPALVEAGVPHFSLQKQSRWDLLRPGLRARRILRMLDPDIVHAYLDDSNVAGAILRWAVPRAKLVGSVRGTRLDFTHYPLIVRIMFRIGVWSTRATDLIISNSRSGARDYELAGCPGDRMRVIPNGIDTERFAPDPDAGRRLRAEWGVAEDEKLIGIVGRLSPMKDHRTFLRAAADLAGTDTRVSFVCVGEGPPAYRQQLMELAQALGLGTLVRWLPAQEDVRALYNALDLLASTSSSGEGFSNVIGEAMACGTHCVVTDVGDSAVIVGGTGVVVPPGDPAAMADGWRRALRATPGPHFPAPRDRIVEEYSLGRLIERTEAVLYDLLPGTGEGG
jgi:glycosyltransferase involved in cell wall biosynthesis